MSPVRIRFFAVGEYGSETLRPHYHLALFGGGSCVYGTTRPRIGTSQPDWENCCRTCLTVGTAWGHGIVQIGELNQKTAQYIARYTVKKLTGNMETLYDGRTPEFARMSLRPGIGHDAMWEVASTLMAHDWPSSCDVPSALRHGSRLYPLGRYLRGVLREMMGRTNETHPATLAEMEEEMRELRESAFDASLCFREAVKARAAPQINSIEVRHEIFRQKDRI